MGFLLEKRSEMRPFSERRRTETLRRRGRRKKGGEQDCRSPCGDVGSRGSLLFGASGSHGDKEDPPGEAARPRDTTAPPHEAVPGAAQEPGGGGLPRTPPSAVRLGHATGPAKEEEGMRSPQRLTPAVRKQQQASVCLPKKLRTSLHKTERRGRALHPENVLRKQ